MANPIRSIKPCFTVLGFLGGWPFRHFSVLVASVLVVFFSLPSQSADLVAATADRSTEAKAVLILSGVQYGLPVSDSLIEGSVSILKEKGVSTNDIFVEYLDLSRYDNPQRRAVLVSQLREKLAKKTIGLVIAQNQTALDFLAQDGGDLLPPGLPVLSTLVATLPLAWNGTPHRILNVINLYDVAGTLRYGLDLFPRTRRLILVAGADSLHAVFHARAVDALTALGSQVEVEDTVALTHEEMLQRISTLPPDTLVLLGTYFKDHTGRSFIPADVAADIANRANVPVLGLYDVHVRQGLTGGSVVMPVTVGRRAGEIGFDLLTGARLPEAGDEGIAVPPQLHFDWLQLQRWGADPAKLPDDTIFLNRPRSIWTDYRGLVIAAVAVILLLSGLVGALAIQGRRRKRAEEAAMALNAQLEELVRADTVKDVALRTAGHPIVRFKRHEMPSIHEIRALIAGGEVVATR